MVYEAGFVLPAPYGVQGNLGRWAAISRPPLTGFSNLNLRFEQVSLIVLDFVPLEQLHIFILKAPAAVMPFLTVPPEVLRNELEVVCDEHRKRSSGGGTPGTRRRDACATPVDPVCVWSGKARLDSLSRAMRRVPDARVS